MKKRSTIMACTVKACSLLLSIGSAFAPATGQSQTANAREYIRLGSRIVAVENSAVYLVGDVYPYTGNTWPNFGNWALDVTDLNQEMFAVNDIPGFRPPSCSDRYDAMDTFPVDTPTLRGGDGLLDVRDLVRELNRVNNLDLSRPMRAPRGVPCQGPEVQTLALPSADSSSTASAAGGDASLVLGPAVTSSATQEQVPIFLKAAHALDAVAFTFGLGDNQSTLHFVAAAATPPTIVRDDKTGFVVAAWLTGIKVTAASQVLLGYISGPTGASANFKVYGVGGCKLADYSLLTMTAAAASGLNQ